MTKYKWLTLSAGDDSVAKPVFAFISPANGFYGAAGQQLIRTRLELLTRLGFEVKIPVFSLGANEDDIAAIPEKINFDIAEQKFALEQMQIVIEPNVVGRNEPAFLEPDRNANSPQTGANIITDCVKNGWNMMPLMGGASFDEKLPDIRKYFAEHPEEKNPTVKIFGYSNITFANSLMLDGICSYCPTPFTNFFSKVEEVKTKQSQRDLSEGESEWLAYLESQAEKLKSALIDPNGVTAGERKILFFPQNFPKNLEGTSMHYPLNADVFTGLESDPKVFVPNPNEKWSFAIEWMIQKGDNPANVSKAFKMLDDFLRSNTENLPQFIELGVLGTRFDGMNGIWDLLYDQDGNLEVSDANVDIILFRESTKQGFVKKLNDFLAGYKSCSAEDKELNGTLPNFLSSKLDHDFNKISEVDGSISREEIKEIFKWRNEVCGRIVGKVIETATKYNLPLVFNSNYGHVANMSPNVAGVCSYRFDEAILNITRLNEVHQDLIAATQKNYEMGKVIYRKVGDAAPVITKQGEADFHNPGKPMTEQTISGIGSITKQFTAATLLKLWDEEITRKKEAAREQVAIEEVNFPDGVDTKLSHFMDRLRARFPKCEAVFNQFTESQNYTQITLRNLLNHTHGLGARNSKYLAQFMHENPNRPLELSEIIESTVPAKDQYDKHHYSNLGYDLAAMIIEVITGQKFDEVVKEKVLKPYELSNTYTQSDHLSLYADPLKDVARGFCFDEFEPQFEANFNTRSNTRAAGGFKSTVEDLAKFAPLYMGAEMFENEEVKQTIAESGRGADLVGKGVRPSMKKDEKYHLGMTTNEDGSVGHPGVDGDFLANLRFYPRSQEVKVSLSVVENLSADVCRKFFEKTNPEILVKIKEFWGNKLQPKLDNLEVGGALWKTIVEAELIKEENIEYLSALNEYSNLRQNVLLAPRDKLIKDYQKPRVTIEALDLATHKEPSTNLEQTCAKKMSQIKGSKFNEI